MKELNKSQLILLAILISFITSIATGIVTVTLMQQAPVSVITPINRIVKQTVEKIIPGETKTQTVVVKEEDLVVDAIAKNQASVFTLTKEGFDLDGKAIELPAGRGLVVSKDDTIVADASLVFDAKEVYYAKNDSGKFKTEFLSTNKGGFSFLKLQAPLDEKDKLVYTLPVFGSLEKMKAGQKIILLGNTISSFLYEGSKDLKMTVTKSNAGGLVLNLDGEVIGLALSNDLVSFAPIGEILNALKPAGETPKTQ